MPQGKKKRTPRELARERDRAERKAIADAVRKTPGLELPLSLQLSLPFPSVKKEARR